MGLVEVGKVREQIDRRCVMLTGSVVLTRSANFNRFDGIQGDEEAAESRSSENSFGQEAAGGNRSVPKSC